MLLNWSWSIMIKPTSLVDDDTSQNDLCDMQTCDRSWGLRAQGLLSDDTTWPCSWARRQMEIVIAALSPNCGRYKDETKQLWHRTTSAMRYACFNAVTCRDIFCRYLIVYKYIYTRACAYIYTHVREVLYVRPPAHTLSTLKIRTLELSQFAASNNLVSRTRNPESSFLLGITWR